MQTHSKPAELLLAVSRQRFGLVVYDRGSSLKEPLCHSLERLSHPAADSRRTRNLFRAILGLTQLFRRKCERSDCLILKAHQLAQCLENYSKSTRRHCLTNFEFKKFKVAFLFKCGCVNWNRVYLKLCLFREESDRGEAVKCLGVLWPSFFKSPNSVCHTGGERSLIFLI